jgi:hypothetical protein
MLSEKYEIRVFVEAVKDKNFADVGAAAGAETADLEKSEDPFLSKDYLKHMTVLEQKKFMDKRALAKDEYGQFLRHLRAYMKDDKSMTLFHKQELGHLDTIFRNISIAENPRCNRYLAALRDEMRKHAPRAGS